MQHRVWAGLKLMTAAVRLRPCGMVLTQRAKRRPMICCFYVFFLDDSDETKIKISVKSHQMGLKMPHNGFTVKISISENTTNRSSQTKTQFSVFVPNKIVSLCHLCSQHCYRNALLRAVETLRRTSVVPQIPDKGWKFNQTVGKTITLKGIVD